jgi:hypothetical protein
MVVPVTLSVVLDFLYDIPFAYAVAAAVGIWVFICLVIVDA